MREHYRWRLAREHAGTKMKHLSDVTRAYSISCCEAALDIAVWEATRVMTSKQIRKRVERALERVA